MARMNKVIAHPDEIHEVLERGAVRLERLADEHLAGHLVLQAERGMVIFKLLQDGRKISKELVGLRETSLRPSCCVSVGGLRKLGRYVHAGQPVPGLPIFQAGHEGSIPFARSDEKPQVTGSYPALEPLRSAPRVPGVPHTCPTNDGWPSHPTSGPASHEKVLGQTPGSGVQPDVLDADDLLAFVNSDGVPDRHVICRQVQFVCAWQGVVNRKWVRQSRGRLIQQVEDRALNNPAQRLRQSLDVLPGGPRKPNEAITH